MNNLMLVLGCGILESKRRAKYALTLASAEPNIPIILTGGLSRKIPFLQSYPEMTEARYMQSVLEKAGISNPIYPEEKANNTAQNLLFSRKLIESTRGLQSVREIRIVDGLFHMGRTRYLAEIILGDYSLKELPVPMLLNRSSLLEKCIGFTMESLSGTLEIIARKKNERALENWRRQGYRSKDFEGVRMFYNRQE